MKRLIWLILMISLRMPLKIKRLVFLFLLLSSCSPIVMFGEDAIRVEFADEPVEWSRGLQFSESLGVHDGMLFVFPEERRVSFWMKDVFFPIDMIFIDANGKVVGIEHAVPPCNEEPCHSYVYNGVKYVLEVQASLAEKNGISIGDFLNIPE